VGKAATADVAEKVLTLSDVPLNVTVGFTQVVAQSAVPVTVIAVGVPEAEYVMVMVDIAGAARAGLMPNVNKANPTTELLIIRCILTCLPIVNKRLRSL